MGTAGVGEMFVATRACYWAMGFYSSRWVGVNRVRDIKCDGWGGWRERERGRERKTSDL